MSAILIQQKMFSRSENSITVQGLTFRPFPGSKVFWMTTQNKNFLMRPRFLSQNRISMNKTSRKHVYFIRSLSENILEAGSCLRQKKGLQLYVNEITMLMTVKTKFQKSNWENTARTPDHLPCEPLLGSRTTINSSSATK